MKHNNLFLRIVFVSLFFIIPHYSLAADTLTRSFGLGATDATTAGEVTILQRLLSQDKAVYPEGIVSGYFGRLTEQAVQRWQAKHGIVSAGTPATTGFGWVGRMTRASFDGNSTTIPGTTVPPASTISGSTAGKIFTRSFGLGATDAITGGEVTLLQRLLSTDKAIYPEGIVNGVFDKITERAVQRWQAKYKIVLSGTPATTGFGWVGGLTRASLNAKVSLLPQMTGALSVTTIGDVVSQTGLLKKTTYTNKIKISFLGTGNGQKATITQTSPNKLITVTPTLYCVTPCTLENMVGVSPGVAAGVYDVKVNVVAGTENAIVYYKVTIGNPDAFDFSMTASGPISAVKSLSGSVSGKNIITLRTISGQAVPVTVTQVTTVKGITVKSPLGTCTPPCTLNNTVSLGIDVLSGSYSIPMRGTAGDVSRSLSYNISLATNGNFGYHISNQEDPDKSITMTRPAAQAVTSYIPLKFILDGGSPRPVRLTMAKLPDGVSATVGSCSLPCDTTLAVTIAPGITIGSKSVSFSLEADYADPITGVMKVLKKTYTQSVKVIDGDQLILSTE